MPNLALNKTARTLNSWSPMHGGDPVGGISVNFKNDSNLIMPPTNNNNTYESYDTTNVTLNIRPTSYDIKSNRRKQNPLLTSGGGMFGVVEPVGRGPVSNGHDNKAFVNDSNGFASQPKPGYVISMGQLNGTNETNNPAVAAQDEYVHSTNNRDVRFQVRGTPLIRGQRGVSHSGTVPLKYVWLEPSLGSASPLILAKSIESLSHLRKWNSQTCLQSPTNKITQQDSKKAFTSKEFPEGRTKKVLKRNASLPDLRQAKQLDTTKLHRARPKTEISDNPLIRSPSDTGRALSFWMASDDDFSKGSGAMKSFVETPSVKRSNYETKLLLFRNHWFNKSELQIVKIKGKKATQDDWSKDDNSTDLSDFSAKVLAEELTLLGRELLLAVEPMELVTYVMKPRIASEDTCPNLFRLLRFYERVTALVATEILRSDNATKRAQIIALIIEAAEKCRLMQNWQSSKALMAGIQCPPVARLEDSWTQLRQQYPDHNSTFEALVTEDSGPNESEKYRQLASMPYFGEVLSRVRGRPTISRLRPARPLWKEPPSLARWVEEQMASALSCDTCHSTSHKNRACCYLMFLVLGKNLFCPPRIIPDTFVQNTTTINPEYVDNHNFRLDLAKVFDDPESLPFTSPHVQCSALQPQNTVQVRNRTDIYLRSAQATARAYDLDGNPRARHYLLKRPYNSLRENMKRSLQVEVARNNKSS